VKGANLVSMADLKSRMHDVPGASGMTMNMDAGQMIYTISGRDFAFDAAASDAAIESTIRAGLAMVPAPQTADAAPATAPAPSSPVLPAPSVVAPTPTPAVPVVAPAVSAVSSTAPVVAAHTVKDMMSQHMAVMSQIHDAQVQLLGLELQKQRDMVAGAIGNVTAKIKAQSDDFAAVMGQFTNMLGDL
jgi:hypothetical protein